MLNECIENVVVQRVTSTFAFVLNGRYSQFVQVLTRTFAVFGIKTVVSQYHMSCSLC